MTIFELHYPPEFSGDDLRALDTNELAIRLAVSRAFIQLCLAAGCPTTKEKLSVADLLRWLFDHYEKVRAVAGLRALVPLGDLEPSTLSRVRTVNGLATALEYARSRASHWRKKKHLRLALEEVRRWADRKV